MNPNQANAAVLSFLNIWGRQGPALWTSYVQFEFTHADEPLGAIQKLYRRQLAVPHLGAQSS